MNNLTEGKYKTNIKVNNNTGLQAASPPAPKPKTNINIEQLVDNIQENIEWLQTTDENEVECIGIENLEGILSKHFGKSIKLSKDE